MAGLALKPEGHLGIFVLSEFRTLNRFSRWALSTSCPKPTGAFAKHADSGAPSLRVSPGSAFSVKLSR